MQISSYASSIIISIYFLALHIQGHADATYVCDDDYDCYPNGTCGPQLTCVCDSGFWGDTCNEKCPLQCQNGGQCSIEDDHGGLAVASDYYCKCPFNFYGSLCQLERNENDEGSGMSRPAASGSGSDTNRINTKVFVIVIVLLVLVLSLVGGIMSNWSRRRRCQSAKTAQLDEGSTEIPDETQDGLEKGPDIANNSEEATEALPPIS